MNACKIVLPTHKEIIIFTMTTTRITKSELRKLIKQSIVEQVGRRWNRDYEENDEDSNDEYKQCMNCEGSGTLGVGLGSKKCFYCHGTGAVSRYLDEQATEDAYWAARELEEQNKVGKDKYDGRKHGANQSDYDNSPMFSKRPWNYKRDEPDESGNGKDANGFSISGPSQVTKGKGSKIPEQAAVVDLGSKANRPQPGDIYVAESDYQPLFFKVIEPKKSSKYGVVYQLAKIASKAERGIFTPDPSAELSSRFHRTFHTGQKAFEIGGDVGVATKWNGRPVKAPGYFRERAEHLTELGGMSGTSSAPKIGDVFVTQDGKFLKVSQKYKSNRTGAESYMLTPIGSKGNKPALSSFTGAPMSATYNPRKRGFEFDNGKVPGFATPYKGSNSLYGEQKFITKSQLKKLIESAIHEQTHGGDFAAWGDEESVASAENVPSKTEPTLTSGVKKGDIFVSSWGYEQTNIDFYEVVAVTKTGKSVKIAKMNKKYLGKDSGGTQEKVMPGQVVEEPMVRRVGKGYKGVPSIKINDYSWANLWDGNPEYETAAGYGH